MWFMAKLDTPGVAPATPRPPRPAVRVRAGAPEALAPAALAEESIDRSDLDRSDFDTREIDPRDIEYEEVVEVGSEMSGEHALAGAQAVDGASITERGFNASTFGLPRVQGGTKLPLANLEMPSARLDLTPSPVPRVALSPATGAVDISLVPGPHGSRNLPTLAAHHALGRRPARRPAAAVTVPPPRRASREVPRLGSGLARDVRSSKREIVLGLAIGLGLSLVLAAVGHTYLRDESTANAPAPELEALMLSARPRAASAEPALAEAVPSVPAAPQASALAPVEAAAPAGAGSSEPPSASPPAAAPARAASAAAAGSGAGSVAPRAKAGRAKPRPAGSQPVHRTGAAASVEPAPPVDGAKPFDEAAPGRTPLSPAESAGLGLDLPL